MRTVLIAILTFIALAWLIPGITSSQTHGDTVLARDSQNVISESPSTVAR